MNTIQSPRPPNFSALTDRLIREQLLSSTSANEILQQARTTKTTFIQELIDGEHIASDVLAQLVSEEYGVPIVDLASLPLSELPIELVPSELIQKHTALPVYRRGNRLFLAIADPTNKAAVDDFKFATGITTETLVVAADQLRQAIADSQALLQENIAAGLFDFGDDEMLPELEVDLSKDEEEIINPQDLANDTPVVKFINKILYDAIKHGASDVHFEPYESEYRVRIRADGILREVVRPPKGLSPRLAARLKVMSRLDISERRVPQDGRIQLKMGTGQPIDFRVSTLPTLFGEKIVLRILDPSSARMGIDALGYEADQKALYLEALQKPQGMILVTGPTGSGKTVSLYTGLDILNAPEVNISTAEDPVEINMEGVNQVQINPKIGFNFAQVLRSFLRQDPDILMVGEIRDLETAEIAIKAAQTGHLVLSTVHTNSAPETINRLLNMGVPAYNIASSLSLIIAQRLARRLCKYCAQPADVPESALRELGFTDEMLADATLKEPVGCKQCRGGHSGRVGIYEVVKINKEIASTILHGSGVFELERVIREAGYYDLRTAALRKAAEGIISLEEVTRVTID